MFYISTFHCCATVHIWSFPGPHFPVFGLNTEIYSVRMWDNAVQKNSKCEQFLRSVQHRKMVFTKIVNVFNCFYKKPILNALEYSEYTSVTCVDGLSNLEVSEFKRFCQVTVMFLTRVF